MIPNPFKGVGTALVTPFRKDGGVDIQAMKVLVERQILNGVDMLIPCGTTGEAVTLNDEEYEEVVSTVVTVAHKRVKVIAGAGSNSTKKTIETSKIAQRCGVDALLVVGPYYNKPTQEGFYQHYQAVAEAIPLPIILYNVPGRTGSNISADTQLRIAEIDNVVATKEASGNLSQIMQILEKCPEGFHVLSGDDNLVLAQVALGIHGVISVVSNEVPDLFSKMAHSALNGDFSAARDMHYRLLDLMEINFIESNPIPVKAALALMGLIEEEYRLPLVKISDANREKIREILRALDLVG